MTMADRRVVSTCQTASRKRYPASNRLQTTRRRSLIYRRKHGSYTQPKSPSPCSNTLYAPTPTPAILSSTSPWDRAQPATPARIPKGASSASNATKATSILRVSASQPPTRRYGIWSKTMPEYKQLRHATKSIDGRTVTGIAAVHGNVDDGGDKSWPGSFADTNVDGRDRAVFLWMHDSSAPPTASINYVREVPRAQLPPKVLEFAPDATGGVEVSRSYLDTPRGNEILAGLTAGALNEMSYAYMPIQY